MFKQSLNKFPGLMTGEGEGKGKRERDVSGSTVRRFCGGDVSGFTVRRTQEGGRGHVEALLPSSGICHQCRITCFLSVGVRTFAPRWC